MMEWEVIGLANNNGLEDKWSKDEIKFERITNDQLVCVDCAYRLDDGEMPGNVSRCSVFTYKPDLVLSGGACLRYEHESIE